MKTLAYTKQIVDDNQTRKQIFRVLVSTVIVLSICYVYFIGSITFSVVARKTLESTMRETSSRVSSLEVEYLTLSNKIDAPTGLARGFVDPHNTIFATRTGASAVAMR
jgi:hypothetical protein